MIQGFEKITADLNEHEQNTVVPLIAKGLSLRHGAARAISNKQIVAALRRNCNIKVTEARVRKIINYIRNHDIVKGIIATSRGYYIATTEQELLDYEESLLGRENAIREVRLSMQRQRNALFT